ncbi:MAG: 4-hydroxy-3-methylbut-2-enyl diphosphate reductase [Treponema sp.]|nr:4-hydroxy-3-methylbut-2-enyl diphosphate reductase [Treponema sp.]
MEVIRASVMGFCMGVRRAVEKAEQALADSQRGDGQGYGEGSKGRVYSLGPLIHNPTVLSDLERRGLAVIPPDATSFAGGDSGANDDNSSPGGDSGPSPSSLNGSSVIIRAHGTTPAMMDALESAGARVIDATCPKVHLSQRRVREWSAKGYGIIIAGDRNHGEVTSIASFAGPDPSGGVAVVQDAGEAEALADRGGLPDKAVLIAQTTFSPAEFARISQFLKERLPSLVVFDSICSATMERQEALKELAEKVDGIIVIGGTSSANTRRLYESAKSLVPLADLIEDASMIRKEFYALKRVGITAGASTPEAVIKEVESSLLEHCDKNFTML